jgi:hypothetical protein
MKWVTSIWITLIAVIICFSACKKDSFESNSIIGKWELINHNVISNGLLSYNLDYERGKPYTYHFKSDETLTLYDADSVLYHGDYKLDSAKLSIHIIISPGTENFGVHNYSISNTTLTLFNNGHDTNGEYTETFIYTRLSNR